MFNDLLFCPPLLLIQLFLVIFFLLSKSVFFTNLEISNPLTKFLLLIFCIKYTICKFMIVRCVKMSRLNIWYFRDFFFLCFFFVTRLLTQGILILTALIEVVVANPVIIGISPLIYLVLALFNCFKIWFYAN